MNMCKTFVLVVGAGTRTVTKGACFNCVCYAKKKSSHFYFDSTDLDATAHCLCGGSISNKSYIQFECEKAVRDGLKIVVLYNSSYINPSRCPDSVRHLGIHVAMKKMDGSWNYTAVRNAILDWEQIFFSPPFLGLSYKWPDIFWLNQKPLSQKWHEAGPTQVENPRPRENFLFWLASIVGYNPAYGR